MSVDEIPSATAGSDAVVEFSSSLKEFVKAVKYLMAGTSDDGSGRLEYVDVNVNNVEAMLVTTGASCTFAAEIVRSGYARIPLLIFERISRAVRGLRSDRVQFRIRAGEIKAGTLTFSHPQISLRLIGGRIADLPIDAPLLDVLAMAVRFRPEEINDSGLSHRVAAAQAEAMGLIVQATEVLRPLGIGQTELSEFVTKHIAKRVERKA